jgi:hypothetical protein
VSTTTTTTTASTAPSPTASRPLGVAILAVLIGIYGFLVFLVGLLLAVGSSVAHFVAGASALHTFGSSGVLAGVIVAIIGLIILGLAVGLWHLRMWALVLTVLFLIITIVLDYLGGAIVSVGSIIAIILLIYLLAVSRHFS